jgi:2-succinyl-6-hydroxy-2,4-cyclohexadiene-1-carboxylate synthase
MGGRLALHVALQQADRIERLILIGGSPGIADPVAREQRRRADEELAAEIERSSIEQFARRWAQTPLLGGQPDHVAAAIRGDWLRSTPEWLASALRGLGTGTLPSLWVASASSRWRSPWSSASAIRSSTSWRGGWPGRSTRPR